jgi:hypothetical protein
MKQELQNKLFEKFPKLFGQKDLPKEESAMCWGIDCPDEWYDVIYKACDVIQNYVDKDTQNSIEFTQVKEKFGKLCMYYNNRNPGRNNFVDGVIAMANEMVDKDFKFRQLEKA